jgi:predicted RNase H-like nuclease
VISVGADGYARGWVAVALTEDDLAVAVHPSLSDVVAAFSDAAAYGVDIPIGVGPVFPRPADVAARRALGAAASTVFLTPPRSVLDAPDYAEANARMRALTGSGVSRQSYGLARKILEVEPIARGDGRVVEVHPEVSFRALAGEPLPSKHTWSGFHRRRSLLARAGIELPDDLPGAPLVDVLDAAAAAWSAGRYARGEAKPLPAGDGERLGRIWY